MVRTISRESQSPGYHKQLYSTVPGLWSRGDTQQPTLILQVGEDTPRSFVFNEVGEEACGFREVLGGLVWNGERELELVFILDGLYENYALFIARFVRKLTNSE